MSLVTDLIPILRTIDDQIDNFESIGVEMKGTNGIVSTIFGGRNGG
jgi:hypothetical protein